MIGKAVYAMAKVLVVDDASFMRMTIKQMLEKNGHETIGEAGNGVEAVKKYVDALKKIKEIDPAAKVVICSAMGQQSMVAQAIQSGAKDFIVKPFEADRLIAAVNRVMSK